MNAKWVTILFSFQRKIERANINLREVKDNFLNLNPVILILSIIKAPEVELPGKFMKMRNKLKELD